MPLLARTKSKLAWALATCFGIGHAPKASGTLASAVALLFYIGWAQNVSAPLLPIAIFLLLYIPISVWALIRYEKENNFEDSSRVVCDEWAGIGLSLLASDFSWTQGLVAFAAFRVFDIFKPFGIRYFDRNYLKGWGVMLDDLLAGLYGALCVLAFRWLANS